MAQRMVQHVFRIHALPVDIVFDHGPQFLSRFCKSFCTLIGSSASLSSGFHPQSNGQVERANQDLEITPGFDQPHHPEPATCVGGVCPEHSSLCSHWALTLRVIHGDQLPLFPVQEEEVNIPSAQMLMRRCRRTWKTARSALIKNTPSYR